MIFCETDLPGLLRIEPELLEDERGFFARTFCEKEFTSRGLETRFVQCSTSFNHKAGTLRGMHYQATPHEETKLIRCTRGAAFDVVIDLRPASPAFKQWYGVELSATNGAMLYVPQGCAHGFLTLEDSTEIFYQISEFYHPDSARGVPWNDPAFGVRWPRDVAVISTRDSAYPLFGETDPDLNPKR